jgi:diguanylate cyclase (GGDEF)-like protein
VIGGVLVQATGGPGGALASSLPLLAVAASLGGATLPASIATAATAGSVVLAAGFSVAAPSPAMTAVVWAVAALLGAALPGRAVDVERSARRRTADRLRALEDEAGGLRREVRDALPDLRGQSFSVEERDRDVRQIARELQADIDRACALLLSGTAARTASVWRPDGDDDSVRLVPVAFAGDGRGLLSEADARDGLFSAAYKAGGPVLLRDPRALDGRVVHRVDVDTLGSVLAIPMIDSGRRWGVVLVDAAPGVDLDGRGRELGGNIASFLTRIIVRGVELAALREGMRENHAFYEACRDVSQHVRIDDVARSVVESAARFVSLDCCAFVLADDGGTSLRVLAHRGFRRPPPDGPFPAEPTQGLLAQAVRHRTPIGRPDLGPGARGALLFGQAAGPEEGLSAVLVLPVLAPGGRAAEPLGALVVARTRTPDFAPEDRERLTVLLHQAGAAISNGRLFAEHEARSVTDGMTGLPNHGRFKEALDEMTARCDRAGRRIALVLLDIDKFKHVNDTYGHPMGDEVIRRLAAVLKEVVRSGTDVAARYGGEEFAVLMEGADNGAAESLAERIRERFKEERFVHAEAGRPTTFSCSVSLGIAIWPDDAREKAQFIDRADQALYLSKQRGRDRVTVYEELRAATARDRARRSETRLERGSRSQG